MRQLCTILLTSLVLLPILWNGASFFHYVVEHTHAFCESDIDHEHPLVDDCLTICHVIQDQDHNQLLSKVEFFELKQYITSSFTLNKQLFSDRLVSTNAGSALFQGRIYSDDIFHPPIC
jgi:hypothetical protein